MYRVAILLSCLIPLVDTASVFAHERPFVGKIAGTISAQNNGGITFNVRGRVFPLFRVSGVGSMATRADQISGEITFFDEHGDELDLSFQGQIDPTTGITGTFTITGGTGHWIGHFGSGTLGGSAGDSIALSFDGTISH
jgi:hypothetical protein